VPARVFFQQFKLIAGDGLSCCCEAALADGNLLPGNRLRCQVHLQLLLVQPVIHPRQHRASLDRHTFIEWQVRNRSLDTVEAQHALVGLDVA